MRILRERLKAEKTGPRDERRTSQASEEMIPDRITGWICILLDPVFLSKLSLF
jgi:hypothetical protein